MKRQSQSGKRYFPTHPAFKNQLHGPTYMQWGQEDDLDVFKRHTKIYEYMASYLPALHPSL